MKTRNSFVSNSSTSSFILVGIPITVDLLTEHHIIEDGKSEFKTIVIGKWLGDGLDVFSLSEPEQLNFIKDYPELFSKAYIDCKYITESSIIPLNMIVEKFGPNISNVVIEGGTCCLHSSYTIKTMLYNYNANIESRAVKDAAAAVQQKYGVKRNENKKRTSK
jgi:hypothetical protein